MCIDRDLSALSDLSDMCIDRDLSGLSDVSGLSVRRVEGSPGRACRLLGCYT